MEELEVRSIPLVTGGPKRRTRLTLGGSDVGGGIVNANVVFLPSGGGFCGEHANDRPEFIVPLDGEVIVLVRSRDSDKVREIELSADSWEEHASGLLLPPGTAHTIVNRGKTRPARVLGLCGRKVRGYEPTTVSLLATG